MNINRLYKTKGVNKIMENETNYIHILQEQINKKDELIQKLIKGIIILSMVSIISVSLGIGIPFYSHVHGYFWSSYTDKSDNSISGDNNTNASSNEIKEQSELDILPSKDDK